MQNVYKFGIDLMEEINRTSALEGAVAIWHLGQEGLVIKGKQDVLYIDLYLSNSIEEDGIGPAGLFERDFQPPLEPHQIANANYVLCSHFHQDHMDHGTLKPLAASSPDAVFVVPASHAYLLDEMGIDPSRIVGAKHQNRLEFGEFTIIPIAEHHPIDETDAEGNHFYLGYVIQVNGVTLYHSGDTVYFPELVEALQEFQIDIACINSNGRDWMRDQLDVIGNMNYREAVEFIRAIHADMVIPMHYDMFASNRENPAYFIDYLFSRHRNQKFHMFAVGERFFYHK